MKIVTWNVNSLKVRLEQLLDFLAREQPDIIGLQETKCLDEEFPRLALEAAGYIVHFVGQKSYNGVALLSKLPQTDVMTQLPQYVDPQKRFIAATINGVRVINVYVVNGQAIDSEKYHYKLQWLEALILAVEQALAQHEQLIVMGDFNIAPEDRDLFNPKSWQGQILCSPPERSAFQRLTMHLQDAFRLQAQREHSFSWWDYRQQQFEKNEGARIDHILISSILNTRFLNCHIDQKMRALSRPSDHAPVILNLHSR